MRGALDQLPHRTLSERTPSVDERLAAIAARQHGRVTYEQLRTAGLSSSAIAKRAARGALHRERPRVYAYAHAARSREAELIAAVLTGGADAALSHQACEELWGLRRNPARRIDVTIPRYRQNQAGLHFHRISAPLDPLDVRVHKGIRVTSVARLLVDLTDVYEPLELTRVIREAAFYGRFGLLATQDAIARANGRHNLAVLDQALAYYYGGSAGFKSRDEQRFFNLVKRAGLPEPRVNTEVHGFEVDMHWPDQRLVIEIDGSGHGRAGTRRDDDLRDRVLGGEGWTVLRFGRDELEQACAAAQARLSRIRDTK